MKNGWQTKKLGELCRIRTGKKDVNEGNPDGGFPFFTCAAEHTFSDSYSFDTEALLIAGNGDVGKVSYYKGKFEAYQRTYVLTDFAEVLPRFLYLILDGKLKDTVSKQKLGNTMPYIKVGMLTDFELPVPPLPEQRRIIGILDRAFEGFATAKANVEKNLHNARALFESHLQSVFTQRGKGWVDRRLGDIAETQYGLSEPMNEEGKGFKIFRMGEVQGGRLIDTGRMKYADINRAEFDKYKLQLGDVLFNRTNSFELVGKTGIFDLPGDYCFASYLVRVLLNPKIMQPAFLNYFMNSERFQNSVKQKASKSINQANINATILSNEFVRFPESLKEQKIIVTRLDSLREETQQLATLYQRKVATLEELKKSLLHQAFSGRL